jgi:hypothetical protein
MEPTDMFGILAIVSLCAFVFGICLHAWESENAQIVIAASSLGLVIFGLAWGAFYQMESRSQAFTDKRDLIAPLMSAKFDKVCDKLGVVPNSDLRSNCFERDGLRVWRDNGRLYVASLLGSEAVTDLIVDEDLLLGGYFNSIIYLSDNLDLRRLPYLARSEG